MGDTVRHAVGKIEHFGENRRPKKRLRWNSGFPVPPEESWAPGSRTYLSQGALMLEALLRSEAWKRIYIPFLEELNKLWDPHGKRLWKTLEMELFFLVALEYGKWIMVGEKARGARSFLFDDGDGAVARNLLGFHGVRSPRRKGIKKRLDTPSAATISRYRALVPWTVRAAAARRLFEALRDFGCTLLEILAVDDAYHLDSYDVFITGIPEEEAAKRDEEAAKAAAAGEELRRRRHRRVPGASRVGHRRADKPGGPGFKISSITNVLALPLVLAVTEISKHDKRIAVEDILPALTELLAKLPTRLRILTADSAYIGARLCLALMRLGFVPNIHVSSPGHKDRKDDALAVELEADGEALDAEDVEAEKPSSPEKRNRERTPLDGTKWFANGHFDLFCECGEGTTAGQVERGRRGRALISTLCFCETCGDIVVTACRWRIYSNPKRYARIMGPCSHAVMRPYLGNPLTFNDKRSKAYGEDRHGYQEGFHSQLKGAYGIGGKNNPVPIEELAHLEYVTYMAAALMWANAIERILDARETEQTA
jgi:hypothetical protein